MVMASWKIFKLNLAGIDLLDNFRSSHDLGSYKRTALHQTTEFLLDRKRRRSNLLRL
jgi:hypothetical protein